MSLQTDKTVYRAGDAVKLTLIVTNSSKASQRIEFPGSLQAGFMITDASGRRVWEFPGDVADSPALTHVLPPGGSRTYSATITRPLPIGTYIAHGSLLTHPPTIADAGFSIK